MAKKIKKHWDSYQDYLNSKEWQKIKDHFFDNFQGFRDRCEITCKKSDKLHLHHFKYPDDWNDDNCENLILISKGFHDLIFENPDFDLPEKCLKTRMKAIAGLRFFWHVYLYKLNQKKIDEKEETINNLNEYIFEIKKKKG